jgi:hypothetical protein
MSFAATDLELSSSAPSPQDWRELVVNCSAPCSVCNQIGLLRTSETLGINVDTVAILLIFKAGDLMPPSINDLGGVWSRTLIRHDIEFKRTTSERLWLKSNQTLSNAVGGVFYDSHLSYFASQIQASGCVA